MKRIALALPMAVALFGLTACKNQTNDNDAIRAGILQRLNSIGTLNMSAMDMDMRSVSVTGSQAHVEVEFRPKTGGAPGAGMNVAYDLEKRGAAWVVLKTQPLSGAMQHPGTSQSPSANQPVHAGTMPNFDELLNPPGSSAGALPPGHPPVSPQQPSSNPSSQEQIPAKKP